MRILCIPFALAIGILAGCDELGRRIKRRPRPQLRRRPPRAKTRTAASAATPAATDGKHEARHAAGRAAPVATNAPETPPPGHDRGEGRRRLGDKGRGYGERVHSPRPWRRISPPGNGSCYHPNSRIHPSLQIRARYERPEVERGVYGENHQEESRSIAHASSRL